CCANVGRSVLLTWLDVLPGPAVLDHPLERRLEVTPDGRTGGLVDRGAGGGGRHVDPYGRARFAGDCVANVRRDVHDVAPPRRSQPDLVHVALERAARGRRRSRFERILPAPGATEVLLDGQPVLAAGLDNRGKVRHGGNFP